MPRFDAQFRDGCDLLWERAQRVWGRRFLGRKPDPRLAGGTEVSGYSDYTSGHDYRYLDWNRCARLDELLSKQFHGTELLPVYLLVDVSPSMRIGEPSKLDVAARIAGGLGFLALTNGNRVAVANCGAGIERLTPLVAGRNRLPDLLGPLESLTTGNSPVDLPQACDSLLKLAPRAGIAVLCSDFLDPDANRLPDALRRLTDRGFTPFVVQVYDRFDAEPLLSGAVTLRDAETGRVLRTRLDAEDLINYRAVFAEFLDSIRRCCLYHRVSWVQTATDEPFDQCLERMIFAATFRHNAIPDQLLAPA